MQIRNIKYHSVRYCSVKATSHDMKLVLGFGLQDFGNERGCMSLVINIDTQGSLGHHIAAALPSQL